MYKIIIIIKNHVYDVVFFIKYTKSRKIDGNVKINKMHKYIHI